MKFFKLFSLFVLSVVQGAVVLNFTQYDSEWVKGKDYNLQYTYLEEPSFSNFQIRLYNSTNSITLKEVSTNDYNDEDLHNISLTYPEATTGRYKIVGLSDGAEISNSFSVRLVLKASPETTTTVIEPTPASNTTTTVTSTPTASPDTSDIQKDDHSGNTWKTIAIIVSILIVLLVLALLAFLFYHRYQRNKKYEEEANTSIWKVPISEKSIVVNNRGVNAYSVPNASITEKDLSFSSDLDGFYSYSSQYRNPEYFSPTMGYRERKERTKSVHSYSTNVTKASNNILDILYPSQEKKEREKSLHEKSLHEKSELSIDLGHSHSQKSVGRRKKHSNSTSNGQLRSPRSKSSERVRSYSEVRARSNSFKANAMLNRKSRVSMDESENVILTKRSRVSLAESEKNAHLLNALHDPTSADISSSSHALPNNNSSVVVPVSSSSATPASTTAAELSPDTPEYYIKHTKLHKKYVALCHFKPKLIDEMNVNKNDVIVIHEVFTDGWGLGKNITTDKEGLLPLNCLNIEG